MVRCIILEDTEIKELKFRLVKNLDFAQLLEKKTTNKAEDFKLVKILEFNNNSIHIYGYHNGEEHQINVNCIPDLEQTLYGDIIVSKFVNDCCVDMRVDEYEEFFLHILEYGNEKELIEIEEMDDDEDITNLVIENDNNDFFLDEIEEYVEEELNEKTFLDIEIEKLELNKVNKGLKKEEYDYSYIQ